VGTESRLNIVFDLLRQLVFGTETDANTRTCAVSQIRSVGSAVVQ
jgi:hypothetical protein